MTRKIPGRTVLSFWVIILKFVPNSTKHFVLNSRSVHIQARSGLLLGKTQTRTAAVLLYTWPQVNGKIRGDCWFESVSDAFTPAPSIFFACGKVASFSTYFINFISGIAKFPPVCGIRLRTTSLVAMTPVGMDKTPFLRPFTAHVFVSESTSYMSCEVSGVPSSNNFVKVMCHL